MERYFAYLVNGKVIGTDENARRDFEHTFYKNVSSDDTDFYDEHQSWYRDYYERIREDCLADVMERYDDPMDVEEELIYMTLDGVGEDILRDAFGEFHEPDTLICHEITCNGVRFQKFPIDDPQMGEERILEIAKHHNEK